MYTVVVYDIAIDRVNVVRSFLRTYLNWVQNSVFEGELTESELLLVKSGIRERIDNNADSIIIYTVENQKFLDRHLIGKEKADISTII